MSLPDTVTTWSAADWQLFQHKVRWAATQHLDTLPVGEAIARLGETLRRHAVPGGDARGPRPGTLVVNLHELDCVTFVETVLALTEFVRQDGVAALADSRPPAPDTRATSGHPLS